MTIMTWIVTIIYGIIFLLLLIGCFMTDNQGLIKGLVQSAFNLLILLVFTIIYWGFFIWLDETIGLLHWF